MNLISDVVSYRGWKFWRCSTLFHFKSINEPKPLEDTLVNNKETALGREKCALGFLDCCSVDLFVALDIEQEL